MKTLTLLRHAKSGWGNPALDDFDRPLNERGRKAARQMGREMRRLGLAFDLVLASPAVRVMETLTELAQGYGAAVATTCDRRLYLVSAESLLGIVRAVEDSLGSLLLVGHNPGMEQLALSLSRPCPLRELVAAKYPTGALAEIRFETASWRELGVGAGTLARFVRPRDLEPEAIF